VRASVRIDDDRVSNNETTTGGIDMSNARSRRRTAALAAIAGLSAFAWLGTVPAMAQARGPLTLAKASYFYVGGKIDTSIEGSPIVGQMYVEYMIPQRLRHKYPVVMVHGGNQTGTNFTGTPDAREGWAQYFVRRGHAVYIVDGVGRGRSAAWNGVYGPMQNARIRQVEERFVAPERHPMWPQATLHTQWPGTGKPGDEAFDQFYSAQAVSIADFTKQQQINPPALAALLDKIGPAVVLIHSQSGAFVWPLIDLRPTLVKAVVAVEPNGPPVHALQMVGEPEWFKDDPRTKLSGLGDVPLAYDPPVTETSQLAFVRQDKPDRSDFARCWMQKEPARKLTNMQHIPVGIFVSEASYHAPYDHCTAAYLTQAGVPSTLIRLADHGIRGNGHMMMLEENNMDIARVLAEWVEHTTQDGRKDGRGKKRR
jgi:pimeloyl-ACP methyl ester carboxylesterase